MDIKKVLIGATTVLVGMMLVCGLVYPDSPLMWLAATTEEYAYMRIALLGVLLSLLLTRPPRSMRFRLFLAGFASLLFISAIMLVNSYTIGILDAVIFAEVAIIFMIEALEVKSKPVTTGLRIKAANLRF